MKRPFQHTSGTADSGSSLVWGLLFITVALVVLLAAQRVMTATALRVLLPATLIAAGLLGLLVSRPSR